MAPPALFHAEGKAYHTLLSLIIRSLLTTKNEPLKGYLKAGCLLTLGENGLGAINWTFKAWSNLEIIDPKDRQDFMKMMMTGMTGISAGRVWTFMNQKHPLGWPYARLFSQTALCDLSSRANRCYVLTCIYISLGEHADEKLDMMPQFQEQSALKPFASALAAAIIQQRSIQSMEDGWTDQARLVGRLAQERLQRGHHRPSRQERRRRSPTPESESSESEASSYG